MGAFSIFDYDIMDCVYGGQGLKKIEFGQKFVSQHIYLFRCPLCDTPFEKVIGLSLVCPNGHAFDFSKKGTLYFLTKQANNEYNREMLLARHRILQAGLFDQIIQEISGHLNDKSETILDVGCGEATPLTRLLQSRVSHDIAVEFDISKDGIQLATQQPVDAFFCVADLAHLPFNDHRFSTIIDLFSPSAYGEFNRVIQPGGKLIKIIPNSGYLRELRELLFGQHQKNSTYSNQQVYQLFLKHYPNATINKINYQFEIPAELRHDMMIMTPMHWGKDKYPNSDQLVDRLTSITVDVSILINQF